MRPAGIAARLRGLIGWRADFAALGLGVLSALALPPIHLIPLLLVAVPGLIFLVDGARGVGGAARRGFWLGFGLHLVGLYWITEAILLESARYWWLVPFAVPALSALLALFIAVAAAAAKMAAPGWRRVAMLAGAWVLADLARQYIGTGFPWNPLGSAWAMPGLPGNVMIQPAGWVSVHGLTGATMLLASSPVLGWRACAAAGAALIVWTGLGVWRLSSPDGPPPGMQVVLVQGNVAQGQKWDRDRAIASFRRYLALTRDGVGRTRGPSVVVWPETASVFWLQQDAAARRLIADAAGPAVAVLAGTLRFPVGTLPTDPGARPRNSLVAVLPDGGAGPAYDKWHLVPFGEYAPSWVPLSVQVVPGQFGFGSGPATLRVPGLPAVGPMICYEAIFPAQVVNQADRPDWLVNITNDAWFGNSSGPRQHLAAARFRAVEEGLPLMRAANTGITAGFDAKGRELGRLATNVEGVLVLSLPGKRPPTSFSRWGLVIPGTLALLAFGAGLGLGRKREKAG